MKKISIAYGRSEVRGFVANYKLILTVDNFVSKREISLVIIYYCTSFWQKTKSFTKEMYQTWTVYSGLDVLVYFGAVRFIWCFFCNKTSTSGKHCLCVWISSRHSGQSCHWRRWTILTVKDCCHQVLESFTQSGNSFICVLKKYLEYCPWKRKNNNSEWCLLGNAGSYSLCHYTYI